MPARNLTVDLSEYPRRDRSGDGPPVVMTPAWRRTPTAGPRPLGLKPEEINALIDQYFTDTYEQGLRPTMHDLAGIVGFDSVAHMLNHIRRTPSIARGLSRALTAIGAEYEDLLQSGLRNAQWMLERIPNFDTQNKSSVPPQLPFHLRQEVQISGVISHDTAGKQLTEQEAYMKLIKCKTYEEMEETVELALDEEGVYSLLEIEDGDE